MATSAVVDAGAADAVWALTEDAIERWMAGAKPGDELVYARGAQLIQSAGVRALQRHHDHGRVTFKQKRNGPFDTSYIAERLAEARRPAPAARLDRPVFGEDNDELALLMAHLRRLATSGQPCPTNRELGAAIDVKSPDRVAYLLRKLISARRIKVEAVSRERRVVTICATGKTTAVAA